MIDKAEEFILKLLLGKPNTITTFKYYQDQQVWQIAQRIRKGQKPGTAIHTLKLPITDKHFETLLDLFGVRIIEDISLLDLENMYVLWYNGYCIGYYKAYEVLTNILIEGTINLNP